MTDALIDQLFAMGLDRTQAEACAASVAAAGYLPQSAAPSPTDSAASTPAEIFTRGVPGRPGWQMVAIALDGVGHLLVLERGRVATEATGGEAGAGSDVEMVGLAPGAGTGDLWV